MMRFALIACLLICTGATGISAPSASAQGAALVRVPFPRDEGILTPYSFERGYPFFALVYDTLLCATRTARRGRGLLVP